MALYGKKGIIFFVVILAVFLFLRIPAVHNSYHQDEYKWPYIVNPDSKYYDPGRIPHPPIGEFVYKNGGLLVGFDNLRVIPLVFSVANLFLIFLLTKIIFDKKVAFWSAGLFALSFFSVLASLMIDTDGAIMPFFMLIMTIGYFKLKETNFDFSKKNIPRFLIFITGAILGFLVKISFGVAIVAVVIDFAIEKKIFSDKKRFFKFVSVSAVLAVIFVGILFASKFVFSSFDIRLSFKYWEHFVNWSGRSWLQIFIQLAKTFIFASPFLILPLFFVDKEIFNRARFFFIFVFVGLFFYVVAFDFSAGALDRYLQFLIVPFCIVSGAVFSKFVNERRGVVYMISISALIFSVQFFDQSIFPMYPKTEWISRILSAKWNFLYPFLGGSGPTPFYISFAFIGISWVVGIIFAIFVLQNRKFKGTALLTIFILGFIYNITFAEEYAFGKINGNSSKLIKNATDFIAKSPEIEKVIVYNDNGGGEIVGMDKYRKRLYVDPRFDIDEKVRNLNKYKEHYLVINIPLLDPKSIYAKYLNSCEIVYKERSGKIWAYVYDCRNASDVKNEK